MRPEGFDAARRGSASFVHARFPCSWPRLTFLLPAPFSSLPPLPPPQAPVSSKSRTVARLLSSSSAAARGDAQALAGVSLATSALASAAAEARRAGEAPAARVWGGALDASVAALGVRVSTAEEDEEEASTPASTPPETVLVASRRALSSLRDLVPPERYLAALCAAAAAGADEAAGKGPSEPRSSPLPSRALALLAGCGDLAAAGPAAARAASGVAAVAQRIAQLRLEAQQKAAAGASAKKRPPPAAADLSSPWLLALLSRACSALSAVAPALAAASACAPSLTLAARSLAMAARAEPHPRARSAELLGAAAAAQALGRAALPALPALAEAALAAASDAGESRSAGIALVRALADGCAPLLAPYLPRLLSALLDPTLAGRDAEAAVEARSALLGAVPPRLLLPALLERVAAVDEGEGGSPSSSSRAGLSRSRPAALDALTASLPRLSGRELAESSGAILQAILDALDAEIRRAAEAEAEAPGAAPSSGGASNTLDLVEGAASRALVALVLRLSESKFDPLFERLLLWGGREADRAERGAAADPAVAWRRRAALLRALVALGDALRSVFSRYARQALDAALVAMPWAPQAQAAAGAPAAKRARAAAARPAGADSPAAWVAGLRAVRFAHAAVEHDAAAEPRFADPDAFDKLLPALGAALAAAPPSPAVAAALDAEPGAREAAPSDEADARAAALARAAVAALAALAAHPGCGQGAARRAHAAALEAATARRPSARLAGLAGVSAIAAALADEYLALLPEALSPVAERLEDTDAAVVARAQRLFAQLEELSGEDLGQYLQE